MTKQKRDPKDVIADALATLAEREAVRCDAHVRVWEAEAIVESLILTIDTEHDAAKRQQAARSLLGFAANFMIRDARMPEALRAWLADRLRKSLFIGADSALGLKAGRGHRASHSRHLHNAALVHALMVWRDESQFRAASMGAEFGVKAHQDGSDPGTSQSELLKHHNEAKRAWRITGPVTVENEITTEACEADLRAGLSVAVIFESKKAKGYQMCLLLPKGLADAV